jgi:methyl-accepting chemotaxis protein
MSADSFRWVVTAAVIISGLSFLIMAGVAVAVYLVVSKLRTKVDAILTRAEPLVETAKRIAAQNETKVSDIATSAKQIAANASDISGVAKDQAHRWAEVGRDVAVVAKDQAHRWAEVGRDLADRSKAQIARVDSAVDDTVQHVQNAGSNVKKAVTKPIREA